MPKIKITEIDNTGTLQLSNNGNSAFILGPAAEGATIVSALKEYSTVSDFEGDVKSDDNEKGWIATEYNSKPSASYYIAKELLSHGIGVVYASLASTAQSTDVVSAIKKIEDKAKYNVRFIHLGDYANDEANAKGYFKQACLSAAKRGDCVALIDAPTNCTAVGDDSTDNSIRGFIADVVTDVNDAVDEQGDYAGLANATTFAAAFAPWINVKIDYKDVLVPGSAGYLLAYANSVKSNPVWYAAAGTFRGIIPELTSVSIEFSNADCEVLQARSATGEVALDDAEDNKGIAINPIAYVSPYGYIVWGNRTLKDNAGSDSLTATSFLNIRVLATEIAKTVYSAARRYTFEQNNNVLWANFKSMITPLLDRMQSGNGINGYKITKLNADRRGILKARITIIPIEAVEDFDIEVVMENSIAEVTE